MGIVSHLEPGALVGELADPVEDDVDDLLADGVVAARVVVGGVLLASDKLFWVKQLTVRAGADLVCKWRRTLFISSIVMDVDGKSWGNILVVLRRETR